MSRHLLHHDADAGLQKVGVPQPPTAVSLRLYIRTAVGLVLERVMAGDTPALWALTVPPTPAEASPAEEVLAEAAGRTPSSAGGGRPASPLCAAHAGVATHQSGGQPVGSLQRAKDPSLRGPGGQPAQPVCHEEASTGDARRLKRFEFERSLKIWVFLVCNVAVADENK